MATGRISKETVGRLQTNSAAAFLWDDELKGFGVRVTSSGSKTYVFQYRMGGREAKTQRYTIGRHASPWTGVAGIYQRHDWKPEKIDALRVWNTHLQETLST